MLEGNVSINELSQVEQAPSFEIRRQERGEFTTQVDADLEIAAKEGRVKFVFQKGIGFVDGKDPQTRYIETSNFGGKKPFFGSCICVVVHSPETRITGVLHADAITDIDEAMDLMRQRVSADTIEVSIIGGQDDASEGILRKIREQVDKTSGWQVINLDILGPKNSITRQVVIDALNGKIYNLQGESATNLKPWGIELPEDIKTRSDMTGVIDRKLIIDVDMVGDT